MLGGEDTEILLSVKSLWSQGTPGGPLSKPRQQRSTQRGGLDGEAESHDS